MEVARDEQAAAVPALGAGGELAALLDAVAAGRWPDPSDGIGLDPYETVAAVLDCVLRATSLRDGLLRAVRLGGDTDTVAALTAGLLGASFTPDQIRQQLPWHSDVRLPHEAALAHVAAGLAALRAGAGPAVSR